MISSLTKGGRIKFASMMLFWSRLTSVCASSLPLNEAPVRHVDRCLRQNNTFKVCVGSNDCTRTARDLPEDVLGLRAAAQDNLLAASQGQVACDLEDEDGIRVSRGIEPNVRTD